MMLHPRRAGALSPPRPLWLTVLAAVGFLGALAVALALGGRSAAEAHGGHADPAATLIGTGKQVFRFDTFGDEQFWGGALQLH